MTSYDIWNLPKLVAMWTEWGYTKSAAVHELVGAHMCANRSRGRGNRAKRRITEKAQSRAHPMPAPDSPMGRELICYYDTAGRYSGD